MKKILSLLMLLVAIVTGASADTEWVMKDWSTGHAGLTYWSSGASANIPSTSTDKNVPAWADESTYDTYTGTGGASNFQLDSKTSTWKSSNPNRVWSFDVNANDVIKVYFMGGGSGNRSMYVSYNASTTNRDTETAFASATADGYTPTILTGTATTSGTVYLWCDNNVRVYAIKVKSGAPTGPTITTQPQNAEYLIGSTTYPNMTVVAEASAGTLSYAWEYSPNGETFYEIPTTGEHAVPSAATATLLGSEALAVLTIDEPTTYYFKCKVTDSNGSVYTDVATLNVIAGAPTITTDLATNYDVIKGSSITLTIEAAGASSYQWWTPIGPIEGATSSSYTVQAGTDIGDYMIYYCAAINSAGTTYSSNATVTTVGRTDCELTNVKFSNGAYGAINNPAYTANTVAVPYMAGEDAPTVVNSTIKVSDGATYSIEGNTITVTAENGTTKKDYTVQAVEMTPLEVDEDVETTAFTAVPTWAFNLYGWDADKGVKFAKKVDESSNMRVAKGNTRLYMFISEAKSITLTSGTGGARNIKVYRNGEQLETPTATAAKDGTITIALDETASNMIMIESNQTGGDGGFTKYAIEKATPTINVVLGANGYSTFRPGLNVKLASGATVYAAKIQDGAVVLSEVAADAVIGYDEGVILKGTEGETAVFTVVEDEATELDNDLIGANALTDFDDYTYPYVLASNGTQTSFVKLTPAYYGEMFGKAFIVYSGLEQSLEVKFDSATAVEAIAEANEADAEAPVKVIKNGKLFIGNYNVAGQLVK